jgi:hypothetical protein
VGGTVSLIVVVILGVLHLTDRLQWAHAETIENFTRLCLAIAAYFGSISVAVR